MEQEGLPYSLQEARIWLDTNEMAWKHHTYKGIRYSLLLVAQRMEPDVEVMQTLYHNLSNYQQLPPWAVDGLEEFYASPRYQNPNGNICYDSDRNNISKFLIWLLGQGVSSFWVMSISLVMEYCRDNGVQRGIKPFLCYLRDKGTVPVFLPESYDSLYCSRVLSADDLHLDADTLHRFKTEGYVSKAYWEGIQNTMVYLHDHHYSASTCKSLKGPMIEMGVFLELNKTRFSKELAFAWRSALREKTEKQCENARRGLLLVVDILADKTGSLVRCSYGDRKGKPPDWSEAILESYLDERALDGMSKSALSMDLSSNRKFLQFLDFKGCKSVEGITVEHIKEFHLQDKHSTAEGKNAYSSRIRGFLRYLARQELIPFNLDKTLPSDCAVRLRPAVVLTEVQSEAIDNYCDSVVVPNYYRDVAVLNLATCLGLRGCDIENLRFEDIDWEHQELALVQKKTKVFLRLPFPTSVGNSLYTYIMEGRPDVKSEFVFLAGQAPYAKMGRGASRRMLDRALSGHQLEPGQGFGLRITRKTFASQLLANGTEVSTISDVLGHQGDGAVDHYLDTNTERLRMCAMGLSGFEYQGVVL
jgi:integrase